MVHPFHTRRVLREAATLCRRPSGPALSQRAEAARMLGMSSMTLYRAIAEGKFPAVRIRGRLIRSDRGLGSDGRGRDRGADRGRRRRMGRTKEWPDEQRVPSTSTRPSSGCSRLRDELLADEFAPDRAARLAAVFESEARAWSQVYELSSLRLVWRAALAAEAGARANAALWARRAAAASAAGCSVARAGLPVGWVRPARRPSPRAARRVMR